MPFPTTAILDAFTRANTGPPPSASYTTLVGTGHKVVSNEMAMDSTAADQQTAWNTSYAANQELYMTVGSVAFEADTGYMVLCVRCASLSASADNYNVTFGNHTAGGAHGWTVVYKKVGGVDTQINTEVQTATIVSGDVIGVRVVGSTITTWINGVLIRTDTDTAITAGGYLAWYQGAGIPTFDNVGGGFHQPMRLPITGRPRPFAPGLAK